MPSALEQRNLLRSPSTRPAAKKVRISRIGSKTACRGGRPYVFMSLMRCLICSAMSLSSAAIRKSSEEMEEPESCDACCCNFKA